jgi:hypothetical protein
VGAAEVDLKSGKATVYFSPGALVSQNMVVEAVERTMILRPMRWLLALLGKK